MGNGGRAWAALGGGRFSLERMGGDLGLLGSRPGLGGTGGGGAASSGTLSEDTRAGLLEDTEDTSDTGESRAEGVCRLSGLSP